MIEYFCYFAHVCIVYVCFEKKVIRYFKKEKVDPSNTFSPLNKLKQIEMKKESYKIDDVLFKLNYFSTYFT